MECSSSPYTVQQFIAKHVVFAQDANTTLSSLYLKFLQYSGASSIYTSSSGLFLDERGFGCTFGFLIQKISTNSELPWKNKRNNKWRVQIKEDISIHKSTLNFGDSIPISRTLDINDLPRNEEKEEEIFELYEDLQGEEFISEIWENKPLCNEFSDMIDISNNVLNQIDLLDGVSIPNNIIGIHSDVESDSSSNTEEFSKENSSSIMMELENEKNPNSEKICGCEGPSILKQVSQEERVQAIQSLGFDVAALIALKFQVFFVDFQKSPCTTPHFLSASNIKQYLQIGSQNALVISLNTTYSKYFLVCAVIADDPSMMKARHHYGDILIQIQKYCRKQRRGKKTCM